MKIMRYSALVFAAALVAMPASAAVFSGYNMNLQGSAQMQGSDLQLNNAGGQSGSAWLVAGLSTTNSFTATFAFSLLNIGFSPQAGGITFALQSGGNNVLGIGGGCVGYCGLNAVGSVVQTWDNNRAGLNSDGNPFNTQAAPTDLGSANLITGSQTVSYDASTNILSMTGILAIEDDVYNISDSVNINLFGQFGATMYAGFTGGTGLSYADQRITNFSITAVPEPETYAMMLAGLGLLGFAARRRKQQAAA